MAVSGGPVADTERKTAKRMAAGRLKNGALIEAVTLSNSNGISARILTYGATLQSLIAPDAEGVLEDVILGYDDVAGYEERRAFLGVTVGRYANRIAGGHFTLDGTLHALHRNDGLNTLHGGTHGFDRVVWTIESMTNGSAPSTVFAHVSPDGDGGFPGEVRATATYTLDEAGDLTIAFAATTTRPTIVNMTNHALFNLAGEGASQRAMAHRLTIPAAAYTPVDPHLIPTGELRPVDGTVFDFRAGRIVAEGVRDGRDAQIAIGRGYDHNFVLDKGTTAAPQLAARLEDPISGRRVEVLTTEPGLQLYTGNSFDGSVIGKRHRIYRMGDGIALEPQKFPDTPNQPTFGSARLDPGQVYRHSMIYRLSIID
jgi:aldose 1-epimerase